MLRPTKRVKTGEADNAEAEIFSRQEILTYQNKTLASYLASERALNTKLNGQIAELELKLSSLLSSTSLLSHQMLAINDQLVSICSSNSLNFDSSMSLKSESSDFKEFENIVNFSDKFLNPNFDYKTIIEQAGISLLSIIQVLCGAKQSSNEFSMEVDYNSHKLDNEVILYKTQLEELKQKVNKYKHQAKQDQERIKVLQLRADRYFPYVKFEGRTFDIEIPDHQCI